MFTGIINAMGHVVTVDESRGDKRFVISTPWDMALFSIGASIACSGCCLTVVDKDKNNFVVDVSNETLSKTNLSLWQQGTRIHLEPSLKMGDEMGGHMVSGHVDGVAEIISIVPDGDSHRVRLRLPQAFKKYVAAKGSIALDGISLTVNDVDDDVFGVNIIPHTWAVTNFGHARVGDVMNFEVDMMARYVARYVERMVSVA